ncbi:protein-export membrane protein SecF [Parvibaculum lavamentivorans DS-1]|uniref:Protein-export membrane protein SecF n=1 Tax=Parvibaculum lavamentivorans (strain DS-1 / DSM 13023 / NCIMB 13966) TaxID=402881 RepID=A7HXL1_PARL1|nr:protein translocase subunit SecF [Parvibaculum lavamentivorans]ABS64644.1 protein-export membrane protein SecF [Parvibaculum lavamentivorans DS-1]
MRHLKLIPDDTNFQFVKWRYIAVGLSLLVMVVSSALLITRGLNFGIDFEGGIVIEISTDGPADISQLRADIGGLDLGEVQIQEFGQADDVLIRVQSPRDGGEEASQEVVNKIRGQLGDTVEYRRVEVVGPQVSGELVQDGILAVVISIALMLVYIWFRFEWQFSLGSVIALVHDVMATLGLFCILQLEFNLTSIAAILTIVGYSMNDTVIVFDRVRENLRKYKKMDLGALIDLSINQTLSRTVMTSGTTLLALLALFIFGGEVLRDFTFAMIFGIFIGTYSSIFIAAPVLLTVGVTRDASTGGLGRAAKDKAPEKA